MKNPALNQNEQILKYIYEHHITPDNYNQYREILLPFFENESQLQDFIANYLNKFDFMSCKNFMKENQHIDAFFHPRYAQLTPHIHDFIEIKYQMKGNGIVTIGHDMVFMQENNFCLIAPYTLHSSEIFDSDSFMINLVVLPEHLPELFPRLKNCSGILNQFFFHNGPSYFHISSGYHYSIDRLMSDLFNYYRKNLHHTAIENMNTESDLEKVLLILQQTYFEESNSKAIVTKSSKIVNEIVEYIQEHLDTITFSELVNHFHYSDSYTSRLIKKQTGHTFKDIVKILRLKNAAVLLTSTTLSIDQIMQEVGYAGKTNFYQNFKTMFGFTPSQFRKNSN